MSTPSRQPGPDLFGRDDLDEVLDEFFHWIAQMLTAFLESPYAFALKFETHKLEFRRHIKEILRHAGNPR